MMFFRELFYIRRSDRRVVLALVAVAAVALGGVFLTSQRDVTPQAEVGVDTVNHVRRSYGDRPPRYYRQDDVVKAERFAFDPNTADSTQLLRLGLRPWLVRNIYKYRARGGVFRRKEDFSRIYGLSVQEYRELEPYIRISADYTTPAATLFDEREPAERDTLKYPVKTDVPQSVNVNTTDTMLLRRVPGIGTAFARRIISYGQRLGGYVSTEQLREIDDFPAEAIPYFVVSQPHTRRINLNQLTLSQLQRHPYISFHQAKAIIDYRRLRGPLHSLQDLRLHRDFPDAALHRLEPYVEF